MIVGIIDYGMGNLFSVEQALKKLECTVITSDDVEVLAEADAILLPGVGAFPDAMRRLDEKGLAGFIRSLPEQGIPLLGICLGMQLMCSHSEENNTECLGIFPEKVKRFAEGTRVPHMGWNNLTVSRDSSLLSNLGYDSWFYYLHSYALPTSSSTIAMARHTEDFSAMVCRNNFLAAQFHPERSSHAGARLLQNFMEWEL